eukprot:3603677-Alexandrium_andersonii.AAC.1
MLVSAAIRLDPQSAMHNMQHRCTRSNLELRVPKNGLTTSPRSSGWGAFCATSRADPKSDDE